jgi:glucosamine-phosphate N-acetyltransferase
MIEKKLIHGAGKVGHIEDVVVDETYRGKKLGQRYFIA